MGWLLLISDATTLPTRADALTVCVTPATGAAITLRHDLPASQTVEEMPVSRRKFALTWRGDEVVTCEPKVPIYQSKSA